MLLKVALTGGIASGKSVVARILKDHGCSVHEADSAARALLNPGTPVWKKIVSHFGSHILLPNRAINRPLLGAIVFSRKTERLFLNSVVHPPLLRKIRIAAKRAEKSGRIKIFISSAALIFEWEFADFFDRTIVVHCPQAVQIQRLMERDRLSLTSARNRIHSQMPVAKKLRKADYLIDTSGTLDETRRETECLYRCLLREYENKLRTSKRRPGAEA